MLWKNLILKQKNYYHKIKKIKDNKATEKFY